MANPAKAKKQLGYFKFGSVLFSTTLSLFIVGLFGIILIQASSLTKMIRENIEIQVFLDKGLSQQQLGDLRKNLAERPFVLHTEDSVYLRFISNKEAAETFIQNTGEDFTQFLEDNPLRDSYVFSVSEEFQSSEQLTLIAKELETQPGVFEVSYMTDLVDSINKNLFKVSLIMGGFILILIVTVIMLINNTIRLALFSQRFLIRSMQLVGATRGFIRKPFLIRAFLFGVLAGILASGILYALLEYTKGNIEGFASLQNTELMLLLFVGLTVTGGFLSGISTLRSVNKYLNMSLDELY
jgi:cell division transport system permease protein